MIIQKKHKKTTRKAPYLNQKEVMAYETIFIKSNYLCGLKLFTSFKCRWRKNLQGNWVKERNL
jgi:hypothetical protein